MECRLNEEIETLVLKYEEEMSRMDLLNQLAKQVQSAHQKERVKTRLLTHPLLSFFLTEEIASTLLTHLTVEHFHQSYDQQRNATFHAQVHFHLHDTKHKAKKHKPNHPVNMLQLFFTYKRSHHQTTALEFNIQVSFNYSKPQSLLFFHLASSAAYPRSFYEEAEVNEQDASKTTDPVQQKEYWEAVEKFDFNEETLLGIVDVLPFELAPDQLVQVFLAMPFHEEEWLLDDRIADILFGSDSVFSGDSEDEEEE